MLRRVWTRSVMLGVAAVCAVAGLGASVYAAGSDQIFVPVAVGAVARTPTPTPTPTPKPSPTPTPPADRYTAMERDVIALINQHRRKAGCSDLILNDKLSAAAERHSRDMAAKNFLNHTGSDGSSAFQRITDAGYMYSAAAENIAAGYSTAESVVQGWYNSEGHRKNMLNCTFQDTGISLEINQNTGWKYFWTNTFARKR